MAPWRKSIWWFLCCNCFIIIIWISEFTRGTVTSYRSYPDLWSKGRRNLPPPGFFQSRQNNFQIRSLQTASGSQVSTPSQNDLSIRGGSPSHPPLNSFNKRLGGFEMGQDTPRIYDGPSLTGPGRGRGPRGKFRRRRVKKRRNGTIVPVEDKFVPGVDLESLMNTSELTLESSTTESSTETTSENSIINNSIDFSEDSVTETPYFTSSTDPADLDMESTTQQATTILPGSSGSGETIEIFPLFMKPGVWDNPSGSRPGEIPIIASTETTEGYKRRRKMMKMRRRRKRPKVDANTNNNMDNHRSSYNSLISNQDSDLYLSESANPYVNGSIPISTDLRNTLLFEHLNYYHPLLNSDSVLSSKEVKIPENKTVAIQHMLKNHPDNTPISEDVRHTKPHPLFNLDSVISFESEVNKDGPFLSVNPYDSNTFFEDNYYPGAGSDSTTNVVVDTTQGIETEEVEVEEEKPTTYRPPRPVIVSVATLPPTTTRKPPTVLKPKYKPPPYRSSSTLRSTEATTLRPETESTTIKLSTTTARKTTRTRGTTTPRPAYTQSQQIMSTNPFISSNEEITTPDIKLSSSFKSNPQKEAEKIRESIIQAQQNRLNKVTFDIPSTTTIITSKPSTTPKPRVSTTKLPVPKTTPNAFLQLLEGLGSGGGLGQTPNLRGNDLFSNLFTPQGVPTTPAPSLTNANNNLNDLFGLLNLFQPPGVQTTPAPPPSSTGAVPGFNLESLLGSQSKGSGVKAQGDGSSLEDLAAQLDLLDGLVKGLSVGGGDQKTESGNAGISQTDLKSIFSMLDNTNSNPKAAVTTSTTTPKPTTTTTKRITTTPPPPPTTTQKPFTFATTTLHPVLKNMLDVFTNSLGPSSGQSQNQLSFLTTAKPTTMKPFLDSVLNAIQSPNQSGIPSSSAAAKPTKDPSIDLLSQLLNLGLAADSIQQQSNSVRSPQQQQTQGSSSQSTNGGGGPYFSGPQPIPSFDLSSLFGLNNLFAQTPAPTTTTPRPPNNGLDTLQLLNLFSQPNLLGNNVPQKRQSPQGLYYWLDLNAFLGGDPTTDPFSGFRPKLGARDEFIRVQRKADAKDGFFG